MQFIIQIRFDIMFSLRFLRFDFTSFTQRRTICHMENLSGKFFQVLRILSYFYARGRVASWFFGENREERKRETEKGRK